MVITIDIPTETFVNVSSDYVRGLTHLSERDREIIVSAICNGKQFYGIPSESKKKYIETEWRCSGNVKEF